MDTEPPSLELLIASWTFLSGFASIGGLFFILILLLLGSALISASEVAYFSLSPQDLESLEKEGGHTNEQIIALKKRPRNLLSTILISNNFINIAIVILSDYMLREIISEETFRLWATTILEIVGLTFINIDSLSTIISFLITVVGVTFLLVLFGEVAPKIYANLNNIKHAKVMAGSITFLTRLFSPFNALLVNFSGKIEEKVYRKRLTTGSSPDRKDLDKAIDLAVNEGGDRDDVDILKGIIKFGDVTTKQIMKSRLDVVSIDQNDDFSGVMTIVKESGYSRIPVYQDIVDNVKGILYVKDLLGHTHEGADFEWQKLIRTNIMFVPESKKIDELLKEFQLKHTHMAIVVDEYGGTSGIVTLEDIMEEVIGDIRDEFDQDVEVDFLKIDDHNYIFDGKTLLNDVARIIGVDNEIFNEGRGSADSLAGLILEIEGLIPKRDKEINYQHLKFKIVSVNKRRIEKINITL